MNHAQEEEKEMEEEDEEETAHAEHALAAHGGADAYLHRLAVVHEEVHVPTGVCCVGLQTLLGDRALANGSRSAVRTRADSSSGTARRVR